MTDRVEVDISQAPTPAVAPAPVDSTIPEKFGGDVGALARAYRELERARSTGQQPATPAPAATPASTPTPAPTGTKRIGADDLAPFVAEFREKNALTPESYQRLEGMGFDRSVVDAHIQGQVAIAAAFDNAVFSAVGGKSEFDAVAQWAQSNLPPAEVESINAVLASGNLGAATTVIKALAARAGGGQVNAQPPLGEPAVQPFATYRDMVEAMKDDRYGRDGQSDYTNAVLARARKSNF